METDYDYASRIWAEDLPNAAEIGARAGRRAVIGDRRTKNRRSLASLFKL